VPDATDRAAAPASRRTEEEMTPTAAEPVLTFQCSICGEPSTEICSWCTQDTCPLHLCERCLRCSDCCVCDRDRVMV
jgi:hypothetical protein